MATQIFTNTNVLSYVGSTVDDQRKDTLKWVRDLLINSGLFSIVSDSIDTSPNTGVILSCSIRTVNELYL